MKAVVLAGGLGTRLASRLQGLPKAMAPVAGRPFLDYVLERLVAAGIAEIILALGHGAAAIERRYGRGFLGARITCEVEPAPLGTGGALAQVARAAGGASILVQNGDTYLDFALDGFLRWHAARPAAASMVVVPVTDASRYGAVLLEGERIVGFAEKSAPGSGWINAGLYLIDPAVFARFGLTGRFSLEQDLLQRHCAALAPRAYCTNAFFIDIGVPEDYERAQRELPAHSASPN